MCSPGIKYNYQPLKIGKIIKKQWNEIPNQYEHIDIYDHVIMSNHIHIILHVNRADTRPAPTTFPAGCLSYFCFISPPMARPRQQWLAGVYLWLKSLRGVI